MALEGVDDVFRVLDLSGVFANAVLGGLIARGEKLDPIGFATLAVLSGLGGGLLRDVLLQHGTPVALTDYAYLLTAFAGAAASYVARVEGAAWDRVWPVVDAIALGCWANAGATKTLAVGLGWLPAVLLGAVTAVGGGAIRDIVLRRVPGILGGNTLYATAALLGGNPRAGPTSRPSHGRIPVRTACRRRALPRRSVARLDPAQRGRMVASRRRPGPLPRPAP